MNPEDMVIADIDALISEQLDRGPVDNYDVNRYPDCNLCPHDWHGQPCANFYCHCERSTGEVPAPTTFDPKWRTREGSFHIEHVDGTVCIDTVESVRYTDDRDGRGYTLADIEAMRDSAIARSVHSAGRYHYQEYFLTPEEREREAEAQRQLEQLPPDIQNVIGRVMAYLQNTMAMICGLPELEPLDVESWFGPEGVPLLDPSECFPSPVLPLAPLVDLVDADGNVIARGVPFYPVEEQGDDECPVQSRRTL